MENVALYCRVSTEEQALNGDSLRMQEQELTNYAKNNNMSIYDIYIDDGYTATNLKRPALQRLLKDIENKKIDRVLFVKLDRWSRGVRNYYKLFDILERNNCNWQTIFEKYDTSTASGRLHINIMLSVAENESSTTSERIKAVFKDKVMRGEVITGKCPLGYKIDNKKLVIDNEKEQLVKDIFNYYERCNCILSTTKYFNNFSSFTNERIKRILKNKIYIGEYKGNVNYCEPIISIEQFNKVQELLKINRKKFDKNVIYDKDYIFSGLLKCKCCGNNLIGNRITRNSNILGKYVDLAYRCQKHYMRNLCNNKYNITEKTLEKYLINHIKEELNNYIINMQITEIRNTKKDNTKAINKIKNKIEKLKDLYLDDLIDKETYKKDYENLNNQLEELSKENTNKIVNIEPLQEFLKLDIPIIYDTLNSLEKRRLWLSIIDYIEIGTNKNEIVVHFK